MPSDNERVPKDIVTRQRLLRKVYGQKLAESIETWNEESTTELFIQFCNPEAAEPMSLARHIHRLGDILGADLDLTDVERIVLRVNDTIVNEIEKVS